MKKILFTAWVVGCTCQCQAQGATALELSITSRYEQQGNYNPTTPFNVQQGPMKLYGTSYGASMLIKRKIGSRIWAYAGTGYYRLKVDRVQLTSGVPPYNKARILNVPTGAPRLNAYSPKYHYNTLPFLMGVQYAVPLNEAAAIQTGLELIYLYTFSQSYTYNKERKLHYNMNRKGSLGFQGNFLLGITRQFGNKYINPALLVPIYQQLNGDKRLDESPGLRNKQYSKGIGLSLRLGMYLNYYYKD